MDEEKVSKEYLEGFNHGYVLNKYLPHLSKGMTFNSKNELSDYMKGYQDGGKEFEKTRAQLKQYSKIDREPERLKNIEDKEQDRDKD